VWSPEPAESSEDEDEDEKGGVCTGQLVEWTAGSVWDTYAYGNHDDDSVGWTPTGFSGSTHIRLQSTKCRKFLQTEHEEMQGTCTFCYSILNSAELRRFMDRSNADTLPHTAWKFLTTRQLKNMVMKSRKRTDILKFKACFHIFSWEFHTEFISQLLD